MPSGFLNARAATCLRRAAAGSNLFYEVTETKRMSHFRLEELKMTGTDNVASNCPFCMTMFEDAKNAVAPDAKLNDIAELVAASLAPKVTADT